MRALVTGAGGFAGGHLAALCRASGDDVAEVSRGSGVDLLDAGAARAAVAIARPDVVYHLAARAHVGESWEDPAELPLRQRRRWRSTCSRRCAPRRPGRRSWPSAPARSTARPPTLPVGEDAPLRPQNPYAVSKASADLLAGFYADAHGLRVIRARAFNHSGPGQEPTYAIASFSRQAAEAAERGEDPIVFRTGNPDTRRDYTDVRDVVRAYRLLAERAEPGVYNVCSGSSTSARELLEMLAAAAGARARPPGRSRARARARGDGGARRAGPAAGRDGLEAGDPARADARRHRRVVARADPAPGCQGVLAASSGRRGRNVEPARRRRSLARGTGSGISG